jgi:hypothetical protein
VRLRFLFRETGNDRGVERLCGKGFNRKAAGGTDVSGLAVEIVYGRGVESKNRESGILGAELVDIMEALEIPGVNVKNSGVPLTSGQNEKEFVKRLSPMNFKSDPR